MKKLTKRTKLILTLISLILIVSLGVGIALSLLSYEDPIDQVSEVSPLGNYDYSKRPFLSSADPKVYKGDIYWRDPFFWLSWVPISDFTSNMLTNLNDDPPSTYVVCSDESHSHVHPDATKTCLAYHVGGFLIDAYESAGGNPIIYRMRYLGSEIPEDDVYGEIMRYDTGNMTGEIIVTTSDSIEGMMTYDQWVFYITVNSQGVFSINRISKKGGDITSLEVGKHGWTLMYADDHYVYYRDSAGNIYRATLDLQNPEFIFWAETISAMDPEYIGTFIHNGYLYYEADYEIVPFYIGVDAIQFAKHTIRRVPLDNPQGASELVAENVLDSRVFGVGNNTLYYQPCIMADRVATNYYWNWSGGQLLGVNLDTLEPAEIVNDIALDIEGDNSRAEGNVLFLTDTMPTNGKYMGRDMYDGFGTSTYLFDPASGALYFFSATIWYEVG